MSNYKRIKVTPTIYKESTDDKGKDLSNFCDLCDRQVPRDHSHNLEDILPVSGERRNEMIADIAWASKGWSTPDDELYERLEVISRIELSLMTREERVDLVEKYLNLALYRTKD